MRVSVSTNEKIVVRVTNDDNKTMQRTGESLHAAVAKLHNAGIASYDQIAAVLEQQGHVVFDPHPDAR